MSDVRKENQKKLRKRVDEYLLRKKNGTLDPVDKRNNKKQSINFRSLIGKTYPIFIHIPKTGGRYLRKIIGDCNVNVSYIGHRTAADSAKYIKDEFNERFTFACIRNPYERFLSACVFNKLQDFEDVSIRLLNKDSKHSKYQTHFSTQKSYVTDNSGKIIVDYIGRFEKFNEFIDGLKERGVDVTSKHEYKECKSSDWETRLTEKTKENIRKVYKEDFELFEYNL